MGTEIILKLRDRADNVLVPMQSIANWLKLEEEEAKDAMYEFFEPIKGTEPKIHDKVFYERTVNWSPITVTPRGNVAVGIPVMEQLRWHRIGRELAEIGDTEEATIVLRNKDIELIWKRWNNNEFKTESIYQNPWMLDCMLDFMKATNRWPDDEEESLKEIMGDEDDEEKPEPDLELEKSEDGREKVSA